MTKKALTFKEGYDVLKKDADLLESQKEQNIDNLMNIIEEFIPTYKACKSRVDTIH